jgi:3-oxo-5alpha-steroid 4-dehydrogenase
MPGSINADANGEECFSMDESANPGRRRIIAAIGATGIALATGSEARASANRAEVRHWDYTADVVIAGSGAAGTSAALTARASGADVLVIERLPKTGGSSAMSGGACYLGGGTPLQKALGFEDSIEAMRTFMLAAGTLHPASVKIELYCDHSLEHFDWLVAHGVKYLEKFSDTKELPFDGASLYYSGCERAWPWRDLARPAPRGHVPTANGHTGGRALMEALLPAAERSGVKTLTGISADRLVREGDGRVIGLLALQGDRSIAIRARPGVVLACGGFIHNRDMLRRYAPELYDCSTPWANAGDLGIGIRMGMGVGAAAVRMNQGFAILPMYPPERVLRGIVVNRAAQRFLPEDSYYAYAGHETAFAQHGVAFLVTDADSSYDEGDFRMPLLAEAASIDELEQKGGFAARALRNTVGYFNEHAAQSSDPLWHKHPKFLAPLAKPPFRLYDLSVKNAFCPVHTFGGLETTTEGQALDVFGAPIPGLYAAGRTSAGMPSAPYIASGVSIGDFGMNARNCVFGLVAFVSALSHAQAPGGAPGATVLTGDPARGRIVFGPCRTCHYTDANAHQNGPSLWNIFGRRAGTQEGFAYYSDALRNSGIVWTPEYLDAWLANPAGFIPGTKMMTLGVPDAQARRDLITYLQQFHP